MDVAGIGVQTITPTTGTPVQNPDPAPDPSPDRTSAERVNPPPAPGTGNVVDKSV
jgi:hypothetical protein